MEDFVNKNTHIFLDLFYKYYFLSPDEYLENFEKPEVIFGNSKYQISEYLILKAKDFFINYFKECLINFKKNLNEILENESKTITNIVYTVQL